eukprot:g3525.t1
MSYLFWRFPLLPSSSVSSPLPLSNLEQQYKLIRKSGTKMAASPKKWPYRRIKPIHRTIFGAVYLAQNKESGERIALKSSHRPSASNKDDQGACGKEGGNRLKTEDPLQELRMMQLLRGPAGGPTHPYLLKLIDWRVSSRKVEPKFPRVLRASRAGKPVKRVGPASP